MQIINIWKFSPHQPIKQASANQSSVMKMENHIWSWEVLHLIQIRIIQRIQEAEASALESTLRMRSVHMAAQVQVEVRIMFASTLYSYNT